MLRKAYLDTFRWYPKHGFLVQAENYILPNDKEFDDLVEETTAKWATFYSADEIVNGTDNVFWVWFKKGLDENTKNRAHMKVNGLTVGYSHTMMVDYDNPDDKFVRTAFGHELGHMIMGHATGNWDVIAQHEFMEKNKLN